MIQWFSILRNGHWPYFLGNEIRNHFQARFEEGGFLGRVGALNGLELEKVRCIVPALIPWMLRSWSGSWVTPVPGQAPFDLLYLPLTIFDHKSESWPKRNIIKDSSINGFLWMQWLCFQDHHSQPRLAPEAATPLWTHHQGNVEHGFGICRGTKGRGSNTTWFF